MKRILLFLVFLFANTAFGYEDFKYTVIKTNNNYSPVRVDSNVDSKRFSHLKKGAKLYSDFDNDNFYRIDLGLDKYYWIEKKYVEVEAKAQDKTFSKLQDITFLEDEKYHIVKIKTDNIPPYNEIETSDKSVDFIIYDSVIDDTFLNPPLENSKFKVSKDEFENVKITYKGDTPLFGHEITADKEGLLLKVKKPFYVNKKYPLKGLIFVIDPGHGGADSGACAFELKEKDLNLQISLILKNMLENEGAMVYLTRENDENIDLYERVDFAKKQGADFLFSIHQNSLANRAKVNEKHGVGVYYYNKETYTLAREIQASLVEKTGFRDDGVNFASFALTRATNPLCILIECGYIIHPDEAKKLNDPEFQKTVSNGIVEGVKKYLSLNAD